MLSVIMEYKFEGRAQLYMFRALQMMNLIPIILFAFLVSKLHFYMSYTVGKRSGSNNSTAIYVSLLQKG